MATGFRNVGGQVSSALIKLGLSTTGVPSIASLTRGETANSFIGVVEALFNVTSLASGPFDFFFRSRVHCRVAVQRPWPYSPIATVPLMLSAPAWPWNP